VLVEFPLVHPSINVALEDDGFSFADATTSGMFHEDYASLRADGCGTRTAQPGLSRRPGRPIQTWKRSPEQAPPATGRRHPAHRCRCQSARSAGPPGPAARG
jgi:hypothetical protein